MMQCSLLKRVRVLIGFDAFYFRLHRSFLETTLLIHFDASSAFVNCSLFPSTSTFVFIHLYLCDYSSNMGKKLRQKAAKYTPPRNKNAFAFREESSNNHTGQSRDLSPSTSVS